MSYNNLTIKTRLKIGYIRGSDKKLIKISCHQSIVFKFSFDNGLMTTDLDVDLYINLLADYLIIKNGLHMLYNYLEFQGKKLQEPLFLHTPLF